MGGLNVEYPANTDAEEIKQLLHEVKNELQAVNTRLEGHAAGINSIGGNMQWLVDNVQGLFQMFSSPQFMSQMTNMLMGGMSNHGGQSADGPEAVSVQLPTVGIGSDPGTSGS